MAKKWRCHLQNWKFWQMVSWSQNKFDHPGLSGHSAGWRVHRKQRFRHNLLLRHPNQGNGKIIQFQSLDWIEQHVFKHKTVRHYFVFISSISYQILLLKEVKQLGSLISSLIEGVSLEVISMHLWSRHNLSIVLIVHQDQRWAIAILGRAGHFQYFSFFNLKKLFFCIFYQVSNLFLHQSNLKSPLPVKLTWYKMQKIIFYYWKN